MDSLPDDLRFQTLTPRVFSPKFDHINLPDTISSSSPSPCSPSSPSSSSSSSSYYHTALNVIVSPIGAAIIIAIMCFVLLALLQPPFVLAENTDSPITHTEISWIAIFVWTVVVFLMVLLIPPIGSYCYQNFSR